MNASYVTNAGTAVYEPTRDEYAAYLERVVRSATGLSVVQFTTAYEAGDLDESEAAVSDLAALLQIGQNGHSPGT